MTITTQAAYVHGITERPDNHEKALEYRLDDTVKLLMQKYGCIKAMEMLRARIRRLAAAEKANGEDN
jgi:hypothetical protein